MHEAGSKYQEFALTIHAVFEEGLHISQTGCDFIFSTFSISGIRDLKALIRDTSNCESDSLIELIYFPDESIQLRLEDQLESYVFQQTDQETVLEQILSHQGKTRVHFEGLQPVLTIKTLENGVRAFLARLNIARQIDSELVGIIDHRAGEEQGRKYKVWLRNMVMDLRARDNAFIKDLFLKMGFSSNFDEYLFFSLRLLEESQNETDLFQALNQHKQRCLKHLQQNDRLEAYRSNHNIETLMAHGIRIPHMHKQTLLVQIAFVDDICLALFNRSM